MSTVRLSDLNRMDVVSFVKTLGSIYESSPWVAQAVANLRPFPSVSSLQKSMATAVSRSGADKQMALIKSHPELAVKGPQAESLTESSKAEQSKSGMSSLAADEQKQFARAAKQYRERHGFPFIVAVLTLDRDAIMRSLSERVFNTREEEIKRALAEIDKIAGIRLNKLLQEDVVCTPSSVVIGGTRSSDGTTVHDVQYGKSRVRVLKVLRQTPKHEIFEIDAQVLMRGKALGPSFTRGDNAFVVPTDTVKNTVLVLARENLITSLEEFGARIGSHFLNQYAHVDSVDIRLTEKVWERMQVSTEAEPGTFNGPRAGHKHSFVQRGPEKPTCHVVSTRQGNWIEGGIVDYQILKTTGSGFEHFPRCALTLLPDTDERILSTKIASTWSFTSPPKEGYRAANQRILEIMLDRFANRYSVSVQATMYEMALDVLAGVPSVGAIKITLPNVHYLLYNMAPFNLLNEHAVFIPTDEPHGTIELHLARDKLKRTVNSPKASEVALNTLAYPTAEPTNAMVPRPKL